MYVFRDGELCLPEVWQGAKVPSKVVPGQEGGRPYYTLETTEEAPVYVAVTLSRMLSISSNHNDLSLLH